MAEQIHSVTLIGNEKGYYVEELSTELFFYADTQGKLYVTIESYFQFIGWTKTLRKSNAWSSQLGIIANHELPQLVEDIVAIEASNAFGKAVAVFDAIALQRLHTYWNELNKRGRLSSKDFKWYIHSLQLQNWLKDPSTSQRIARVCGWDNYTYLQWKKVELHLRDQLPTNWSSHLLTFPSKVFDLALEYTQLSFPFNRADVHELATWFIDAFYNRFSPESCEILDRATKRRYQGLKRGKTAHTVIDLAAEVEIIARLLEQEHEAEIWDSIAPNHRNIALKPFVENEKIQLPALDKLLNR